MFGDQRNGARCNTEVMYDHILVVVVVYLQKVGLRNESVYFKGCTDTILDIGKLLT